MYKWIKQNIVVKNLWGYSENAVRTHLWVAIIAYLIIAKIKADYKSSYSITEVATLIRISALERVDLRDHITKPKDSIIQKQDVKELTLFDGILITLGNSVKQCLVKVAIHQIVLVEAN